MTANGWLQILLFLALVFLVTLDPHYPCRVVQCYGKFHSVPDLTGNQLGRRMHCLKVCLPMSKASKQNNEGAEPAKWTPGF
jgi:hypothetical protein